MPVEIDWFFILTQALGLCGILCGAIAFQCKKHSNIMLFRTVNELLFAIQYLLLGAYTGMAMDLIGCLRNQLFASQIKRNKSTLLTQIIFCIIFLIGGIATWSGYISILAITAKLLSTVAYSLKNTKILRLIILTTSSCWLVYNAMVSSWAGVLCEVFTLSSIVISLFRFYILPKLKKRTS